MAGYLYDVSGRATWVVSTGLSSLDGTLYKNTLLTFANGQTLSGSYSAAAQTLSPGSLVMSFTDAQHGTLTWPGGTVAIERFPIAPTNTNPKPAFVPESGWWWNASESGRGFFFEFDKTATFLAGYMYDAQGNPIWYLSNQSMTSPQTFQGNWMQFGNGQTLTGPYKPASQVNANVGTLKLQFSDKSNAVMTMPDGRQLPITRFRF
jgi:hypothetical protein